LGIFGNFFKKEEFHPFFIHHPVGTTVSSAPNPTRTKLGTCFFSKAHMSFFIQSTSVSTQIKQELGETFFFRFKGSHHFSSNGRQLDEKSPITPH
jgi:hypothetical protein